MKDLIICRCEGVCLTDIKKSIEEGANSIPGVKLRTRVGMGPCQGRICQQLVSNILMSELGEASKPHFQRAQTPVRPILMDEM